MPKKGEEGYEEFLELNRKAFRIYMKKYIDAIHQAYPEFQITSNWSYSSMMPEKIDTPVDFLSGDVAGQEWGIQCSLGSPLSGFTRKALGFNVMGI